MSKKKLLLASAVFAAGIFTASCGGGDGGGTTTAAPPPPSSPPPPTPNKVGSVLVSAQKGFSTPGILIGHYIGDVYDDGTINWTEIPTPFDVLLDYMHEFSNGNVLLTGLVPNTTPPPAYIGSGAPFMYNHANTSINPITSCVDYATGTPGTPSLAYAASIATPNFFIDSFTSGTSDIDAIYTSGGACIDLLSVTDTLSERLLYVGKDYIVVGDGVAGGESVFIIKKDGTITQLDGIADADGSIPDATTQPFPGLALVYDKVPGEDTILIGSPIAPPAGVVGSLMYIIHPDGTVTRLQNEENLITGDNPIAGTVPAGRAKIRKDPNGNIHVAYIDTTSNNLYYFKVITQGGITVFSYPNPIPVTVSGGTAPTAAQFGFDRDGYLYVVADAGGVAGAVPGFISCDSAITTEGELLVFHIDNTNTAITPLCADHPSTANELSAILVFESGIIGPDNAVPSNYLHFTRSGGTLTNAALHPQTQSAIAQCAAAKAVTTNYPLYFDVENMLFFGEGTQSIQCSPTAAGGEITTYAWVSGDTSTGTYAGDVLDPSSGVSATNPTYPDGVPNRAYMVAGGGILYLNHTGPGLNASASYYCVPGPATDPNGGSCSAMSFAGSLIPATYVFQNAPAKIKADNNLLSDGFGFAGTNWLADSAPNIDAVYFSGLTSSPYRLNILNGSFTNFQVPFSTTLLPARGGNISLQMDKVANAWSPVIGGVCASAGFFDGIIFEYQGGLLQIQSTPTGACIFNVNKTW